MSHEPEASVDDTAMRVSRTIEVRAPLEAVWETLTAPRWIAEWFGQRADFPDGMHEGATGTFGWEAHGDFPARIEAWEAPHRFAFRWGTPGAPIRDDNSTVATFTLERVDDVTRLTVVETGFDRLADAGARRAALEGNREGWTEELDDFVAVLARRWTPAVVDRTAGTITRSLEIEAPRDLVWRHLTDPAAIEAWWGHPTVFPGGVRAGVTGTFEHEGRRFPIALRIVDAPSTFAFRWGAFDEAEPGPEACDVRFDLEETMSGATRVTVVESGWMRVPAAERDERMEQNVPGWELVLDGLRAHVLAAA